jgi:sigma-B regulation protein RsbU (phosphoserine phosphatase)
MSQTGMSLTWAFVLSVGFAVALAAVAASFLNFRFAKEATITALDDAGTSAAAYASNKDPASWEPRAQGAFTLHGVTVQPVKIQRRGESVEGMVYRGTKQDSTGAVTTYDILVDSPIQEFGRSFALSLLVTSVVIVGVGIGVAFLLSRRVTAPITALIEDVRILSHGNLDHRVRVQAGGELGLLAKSVDRMIRSLRDAREAERETEMREHELAVAAEVRTSLLPETTPQIPGYEVAAHAAAADSVGGDLYDTIEKVGDGTSVGFLVAGISARGVPGAMLMTMARAYLHGALETHTSPAEALKVANRAVTRDMRRGLFVTALVAILDPREGRVRVACAGHKAPLFHYKAAEQKVEWVHPEGIALGFDPGPVFDRTVQDTEIHLAPGDRVVLTTSGVSALKNEADEELGENRFVALVTKHATKTSEAFCQLLGSELDRYRGDGAIVEDIVIVTVRRKAKPGGVS